ncbi:hypothetical protein [Burkholderia cepacia]|uniref:hypothetical protein n=1 Tax=Burkholderia cepacia TaxID=292 RepID=UPI000A6EAB24|nr:hypothetical protein [Burkholderia cepacia]UIY59175.1 hypothetical protein LZ568_29575 [Burkholderia cepacia]
MPAWPARGSLRRIPLSPSFLPPHAAALNRTDAIEPDNIFFLSFQFRFVIIEPISGGMKKAMRVIQKK